MLVVLIGPPYRVESYRTTTESPCKEDKTHFGMEMKHKIAVKKQGIHLQGAGLGRGLGTG